MCYLNDFCVVALFSLKILKFELCHSVFWKNKINCKLSTFVADIGKICDKNIVTQTPKRKSLQKLGICGAIPIFYRKAKHGVFEVKSPK